MVALTLLTLSVSGLSVRETAEASTGRSVYVAQPNWDVAGHHTLRNLGDNPRKDEVAALSGAYPERDRDLGQTFTTPSTREPFHPTAITLRTGSSEPGAAGASVSIQIFRVDGWPAAHDNKTRHAKVVTWTDDPRADDYLTGETYVSLGVFSGGRLPKNLGADRWLRFELKAAPVLQPGQRYAFILMLDQAAAGRALDLGSVYWGTYAGGHAMRREGSVAEGWNDPSWSSPGRERLPKDWKTRLSQSPSVWGRPDVDTWRDLCFFIEGRGWFGG
ncbi:hypothetical protein EON81_01250 [bacterium]|nr:MAG: hypothetical protein EON81_01250 [bacterium]